MKKSLLAVVAVAALAAGGVAQADVIDSVGNTISRIFGVPYSPTVNGALPSSQVYTDGYGRHYQIDPWGRTVYLSTPAPAYGAPLPYAVAPSYDQDGDGVADQYDRYPYDARYR